jgi:integrase
VAQTGRSDDGGLLVDVENVEAVAVPLRRSADGALVADWGQVPARVYVAGLAGDGRRTMTACLQAIAVWVSGGSADIDTLPWARLRFSHTTAIRAALARAVSEGRYAPATANKHLAALRGALKAAWRMGAMGTDDYMRAVDLRPITGSRLPAGRDVERSELAVLLAQCRADDSPAGVRDAAVIGLAYLSGTRRAELVALHLDDVDTDPAALPGGRRVSGLNAPKWQGMQLLTALRRWQRPRRPQRTNRGRRPPRRRHAAPDGRAAHHQDLEQLVAVQLREARPLRTNGTKSHAKASAGSTASTSSGCDV